MPAPLARTKTPGVFKRGNRYAVLYRGLDGRQRQESSPTYDAARLLKSKRETESKAGVEQGDGRLPFGEYALDWIDRYPGRGQRGFREQTRRDYRRDLERYAVPFFDGQVRKGIAQIGPRDVARFIGWLCDDQAQGERAAVERRRELELGGRHAEAEQVTVVPVLFADATVRRILASVRACMATAMHEGLIRHNPTAGAALPVRDAQRAAETGDDDTPDRRALGRDELAALLVVVPARHQTLVRLLASTGLRISEALALRWQDVTLDGSQPRVKVRRAYVKGRFNPPKSKHGRRDVPISHELVRDLRRDRLRAKWADDDQLIFCADDGRPLHDRNLSGRMLKLAGQEAGVPWVGWHTFRHTCASMLFARGANAVQVQRWLGHHSPGFTLATYVHLLDEDFGEPLDLAAEMAQGVSRVSARPPDTTGNAALTDEAEIAA